MANAINDIESAPPETAQVTLVPGAGNVHLASKFSVAGSIPVPTSASANERADPAEPLAWVADFLHRGQVCRTQPADIDCSRPSFGLDRGDEPFTRCVLVELALDSRESEHQPSQGVGSSPPCLQARRRIARPTAPDLRRRGSW